MKKKHLRIIEMIQENVPKELLDKLMIKVPVAPVSEEIVKRALEDPEVSEEIKEQMRTRLDSGYFDNTKTIADPEVEKQISEYYEKEIDKAVKMGLLPKKRTSFISKIKKYGKKRNASNGSGKSKESDHGADNSSGVDA